MDKKKIKTNNFPFFKKLRFKYRISFLDENTLEEARHFRFSPLVLFFYFGIFSISTFILLTILIFATPIRYYLPGYEDENNRISVLTELMQTDSLQNQIHLQVAYLNSIKEIIAGDMKVDQIIPLDSFVIQDKTSDINLKHSSKEQLFVEKFEEEEKYNLSSIIIRNSNHKEVFFAPTQGVINKRFNKSKKIYGISILTEPNKSVLSVLDGTVIFADYSFDNSWVIQVQHDNNYVSIYKNNNRLLKEVGSFVSAGESIALTGSKENNKNFYFELWQNEDPIDPEEIIVF